jgi:hypothetical protein
MESEPALREGATEALCRSSAVRPGEREQRPRMPTTGESVAQAGQHVHLGSPRARATLDDASQGFSGARVQEERPCALVSDGDDGSVR